MVMILEEVALRKKLKENEVIISARIVRSRVLGCFLILLFLRDFSGFFFTFTTNPGRKKDLKKGLLMFIAHSPGFFSFKRKGFFC